MAPPTGCAFQEVMFVFPSSIHYINMCVCIYIYVYAFKQEIFYPRGFWSVTCYLGCTSTESFRSERCHFGHIRSQQLQFWLRASQEAQIQISWRHVGLCCPSAKIGTNQIVGKTSWPLLPRGKQMPTLSNVPTCLLQTKSYDFCNFRPNIASGEPSGNTNASVQL